MDVTKPSFQFKDNPYQYTRGIRFQAEPERQGKLFKQKSLLKNSEVNLSELAKQLLNFHQKLKDLLFYPNKETNASIKPKTNLKPDSHFNKKNSLKFQKNLFINKSWLKTWHKNLFYLRVKNINNKQGKYPLNELWKWNQKNNNKHDPDNLETWDLKNWIKQWFEKSCILKDFGKQAQDKKIRHSEIGESIRFFLNRNQWDYIYHFLTELNTKEASQDEKIQNLKDGLEKIYKNLKQAEEKYLSSQSSGIEIAKASFNYYTLNKKPKNYYENKLKTTKEKLYTPFFEWENRKISESKLNKSSIKSDKNSFNTKLLKSQNLQKKEIAFSKIVLGDKNNRFYRWSCNSEWFDSETVFKKNDRNLKPIFCFKSDQEKLWLERYLTHLMTNKQKSFKPSANTFESIKNKQINLKEEIQKGFALSLDQTYTMMKIFKAEQKSIFYEVIAHISSKQDKSYEAKNNNHILKGFCLAYDQLNMEGINQTFSLFQFNQFKNKKPKKKKSTIYNRTNIKFI